MSHKYIKTMKIIERLYIYKDYNVVVCIRSLFTYFHKHIHIIYVYIYFQYFAQISVVFRLHILYKLKKSKKKGRNKVQFMFYSLLMTICERTIIG